MAITVIVYNSALHFDMMCMCDRVCVYVCMHACMCVVICATVQSLCNHFLSCLKKQHSDLISMVPQQLQKWPLSKIIFLITVNQSF